MNSSPIPTGLGKSFFFSHPDLQNRTRCWYQNGIPADEAGQHMVPGSSPLWLCEGLRSRGKQRVQGLPSVEDPQG